MQRALPQTSIFIFLMNKQITALPNPNNSLACELRLSMKYLCRSRNDYTDAHQLINRKTEQKNHTHVKKVGHISEKLLK